MPSCTCRMFHRATRGHSLPKYLSSDHDPLYRFHQCEANLRILNVTELKTVPYMPLSHPFVERLIGTIRREYLDRILFWSTADLEAKLIDLIRQDTDLLLELSLHQSLASASIGARYHGDS